MKKVYFMMLLCLLGIISATFNKHKMKNKKFDLSFSTESLEQSKEKPTTMDNIFSAKPIKVSASFSTIGEEKETKKENLSKEQRFKETMENANNFELKNLEAPTIVPSLGYENQFNIQNRVAQRLPQTITNRQAYDLIYPTHQDYYKDKRFIVFDRNFNKVEDYLLNQFKSTIDSAIDYSSNSKLEHVDNFDKSKVNLRGLNLQNNAPFIPREAVATSMKYEPASLNDPNVKITSSDPYNTIFGKQ